MRPSALMLAMLLLGAAASFAAESAAPAASDSRYPVAVTPEESILQKKEMRGNLVALRETLLRLADQNFVGAEESLHQLAHTGPATARPGVSTEVFRQLEKAFEDSVDKTIEAVRSKNIEVVLRALGETMGYCQSCHMAFRQAPKPALGNQPKQP